MSAKIPTHFDAKRFFAVGYATPKEDKSPQQMYVLPKRVIPIVFLPGIMGSNLRMSPERQAKLGRKKNVAWRPDWPLEMVGLVNADPARRQRQLDPSSTVVDTYDGGAAPTGDADESASQRQACGSIRVTIHTGHSLLLMDDPPTVKPRRTKEDKALERGWGEVYFGSYRSILEECEQLLNRPARYGSPWGRILDTDPATWGAVNNPRLTPLTEPELAAATKGCMFPVHAMGYNWLQSITQSAIILAGRITDLIQRYKSIGLQCEKVIIVTHSMGGLVGRALVHPEMGNIENKILGVVHGVQPATGAPAAYKRMRCGFEEGAVGIDPAPKILGNFGAEVTAVLGNSIGGLQLLPSCAYGNGWLRVIHNGHVIESWPKNGDPYAEIYCVKNKWFALLREEWLNPAKNNDSGFKATCNRLSLAKKFHDSIKDTYHPVSYAHYGADTDRSSWSSVSWVYGLPVLDRNWRELQIVGDSGQGLLSLANADHIPGMPSGISAKLGPAVGPGDQTVPTISSDHQLLSGKFEGIFRQTGYEHQNSYKDIRALHSTLFSIVKIAARMRWESA
jgi:pimeloyl-ACP methyl ester carboxylesterase